MTPILGETLNEVKTTKSSPRILPETVIYDVDLTLKLSSSVSVTSGFNAVAHAVEALYAKERNPVISMIAEEGIKAVLRGLPSVVADGSDIGGRTDALYGAWLCGICLGSVGMALHHKLCHTLGGTFGLAHADIHTIVLPHALAYNWTACADAFDGLRGILGNNPPQALQRLAAKLGGPTALRDLGMPAEGIERAADLALANPYWNPRPLEKKSIRKLLEGAWAGDPPLFEG
jgi:alcohol dehydrogenase class IV